MLQSKFTFLYKHEKASDMQYSLQLDIHLLSLSLLQVFYGLEYVIVLLIEVRRAATALVKISWKQTLNSSSKGL